MMIHIHRGLFSIFVVQLLSLRNGVVLINARKDDERHGREWKEDAASASLPLSRIRRTARATNAPHRLFKERRPSTIRGAASATTTTEAMEREISVPSSSSCPPAYDTNRVDYVSGDVVSVYNTIFKCRSELYEEYCNIATLEEAKLSVLVGNNDNNNAAVGKREENVAELWQEAWEEIGECGPSSPSGVSPPLTPTATDGIHTTNAPADVAIQPLMPAELLFSNAPTLPSSVVPSWTPSESPSVLSSNMPSRSRMPTASPTTSPTVSPTLLPSSDPTTVHPTYSP